MVDTFCFAETLIDFWLPPEKIIPTPLLTIVYQERVYSIFSFVNLYKVLLE